MDGPTSPEQQQAVETTKKAPQERDVLRGNLIHFTSGSKVPEILKKGLLSTKAAKENGMEKDFTRWERSRKDQVYFYEQVDDPEDNELFLLITGAQKNDNIAIVIPKDVVHSEPADPVFPSGSKRVAFSESQQKMVEGKVEREKIIGIILVAGPSGSYDNPDIQEQRVILQQILEKDSRQNPDLAVPLYDQNGNMLWPVKKSREEILRSL